MAKLIIMKGSDPAGEPFLFNPDGNEVVTIGRNDSNDLVFAGKNVSRHHIAIVLSPKNRYFVRDLGSQNGTRVNGEPVYRHMLRQGDRIGIGEFELVYDGMEHKILRHKIPVLEDDSAASRDLRDNSAAISPDSHTNLDISYQELPLEKAEAFNDIARRFAAASNRAGLLDDMLHTAKHASGSDRGYCALFDNDGALYITAAIGMDLRGGESPASLPRSVIDAVVGNKSVFCSDMLKSSRAAVICVPLLIGSDAMGIMLLEKVKGKYNEHDARFLTLMVEYAASFLAKTPDAEQAPAQQEASECAFAWKCRLVGNRRTKSMQHVYKSIRVAVEQDNNILLLGQTGSGKEVVAGYIHSHSKKRDASFVPIELSALRAGDMAMSNLFGHVKGSFTGALDSRRGKFEIARGGTLFLDEIGDISLELQAMLRRAIENKEIAKIGGEKMMRVDVRVISATNRDLDQAVTDGLFRNDLLERLGKVIHLPPLKERKEDIPLLTHFFVDESGTNVKGISPGAMRLLCAYDWPRNVRELRNCIAEAIAASEGREILYPWDFDLYIESALDDDTESSRKLKQMIKETERDEIVKALETTGWNVSKTAELLGLKSRQTLYSKMKVSYYSGADIWWNPFGQGTYGIHDLTGLLDGCRDD